MARTLINAEQQLRDGAIEMSATPLAVDVYSCRFNIAGVYGLMADQIAFALTNAATNYIFIDSTGTFTVNTTGYPATAPHVRLGTAVCAGGVVTAVSEERAFLSETKPASEIKNELSGGTIDGSNLVFTTTNSFVSGSQEVFLNGVLQFPVDDYTVTGAAQFTFVLGGAPATGDKVWTNYTQA